jgi:hypothetical protein
VGATLVFRATLFIAVGGFTWSAGCLCGQVLTETARRAGIRAHERAMIAQRAEASLQQRVDMLISDKNVETWASAHGMVAFNGLDDKPAAGRKGVVALNP